MAFADILCNKIAVWQRSTRQYVEARDEATAALDRFFAHDTTYIPHIV